MQIVTPPDFSSSQPEHAQGLGGEQVRGMSLHKKSTPKSRGNSTSETGTFTQGGNLCMCNGKLVVALIQSGLGTNPAWPLCCCLMLSPETQLQSIAFESPEDTPGVGRPSCLSWIRPVIQLFNGSSLTHRFGEFGGPLADSDQGNKKIKGRRAGNEDAFFICMVNSSSAWWADSACSSFCFHNERRNQRPANNTAPDAKKTEQSPSLSAQALSRAQNLCLEGTNAHNSPLKDQNCS